MTQVCRVTVMDETDPDITFDAEGVSNHVHVARWRLEHETFRGPEGERRLEEAVALIKRDGQGAPYDCVVGVSGGVDSTYAALMAKDHGLRVLAVHVDVGWNTDIAVSNVERLVRACDFDLHTVVVDWEEVKDLQRAYFKASVLDIECVADQAIYAALFHQAAKRNVRWILSGMNVTSEAILPKAWNYDKRDARNLRAIHRRFGERPLKAFPTISLLQMARYIFVKKIKFFPILNYGEYRKEDVIEFLKQRIGYQPYARKHGESKFTRFYQEYYLTRKFGIDKRKAHLSALIVAGQMTREEAMAKLRLPLYAPGEDEEDVIYVAKKLDFDVKEFLSIMAAPPRAHRSFPNNAWAFDRNTLWAQLARSVAKNEGLSKIFQAAQKS
jgi:N-acetyl sugar amidotransferase